MSTLSPHPLLPTFIPSFNALLAALALPFSIDHPTDLTPSLLLAIFESLICARLPIPSSVRQSRTRDAKARAMLVLLGVLECDVLRGGTSTDAEHSIAASTADDSVLGGAGGVSVDGWVDEIGLGEVDPERLADGGWEETIFVGELLCWLARRKGILPRTKPSHRTSHPRSLYSNYHSYGTEGEGDTAGFSTSLLLRPSPPQKSPRPPSPSPSFADINANAEFSILSHISDVPRHPLVHSPEPSFSVSATTNTDLSIRARSVSSHTSVSNAHDDPDEFEEASQDTLQLYDPRRMMQDAEEDDDRPPTFRPWCIHELDDPSYIRALAGPSSSFDPSVSHERVPEDEDDLARDETDNADEQDYDDLYEPSTPTLRRVRLTGWIEPVDSAAEFSQFAASRAHSRSRVFNASPSTSSGPPSRSQMQTYQHALASEFPKSTSRLKRDLSPPPRPGSSKPRTPRRASLSPPPSPPLSPPPPTSSKHPPARWSPSPPPSPPSPPAYSDPPFDVSFSTLNNTSTPAKPRPPRRPRFHASASDAHAGVDRGKSGENVAAATATAKRAGTERSRRRDRSPSYTPSPPSFTTPGSLRNGSSGAGSGFTPGNWPSPPVTTTTGRKTNLRSTSPSPTSTGTSTRVKGKSPPPGSTAMTNSLLTERARLLTELAALKRARAASSARDAVSGIGPGTGGGGVGRRVGVGV
ncbi:hypothetical protein L210DRAFT_3759559 [Boletus edulis BED1]|uniref:Uncharacterized protein n=1 Tax=Boletus edulis BED1 TaxID=1328754 RepID=A0AAD4BY72_BOLED|nr:hypothetical protein L210DRAFT_3759559 [Boletus edulis BED1]